MLVFAPPFPGGSLRYYFIQLGKQILSKADKPSPGTGLIVVYRCNQTNEGAIGSIPRNRVSHHPKFARIFTGDDSPSTLIPIKDQLLILVLLDHIFIHDNLAPSRNVDCGEPRMDGIPARSWQTIFRRMDCVARFFGLRSNPRTTARGPARPQ